MPKKCEFLDCGGIALFNIPGQKAKFCGSHRSQNMLNINLRKCISPDCNVRATFNIESESVPIYCKTHKTAGMINVDSPKCIYQGCRIRPSFNKPNKKKALYCATHQLPGMVDVVTPRCIEDGCTTVPSYNKPGQKTKLYCTTHKKDGMIYVQGLCEQEGCFLVASYNLQGQKTVKYCKEHKTDLMIDVRSTRCEFDNCFTQPCFNDPEEEIGRFCVEHREPGMVNVICRKCELCDKQPRFNTFGKKYGRFCLSHKDSDMIDVVSKRCINDLCMTMVTVKKYEGYCYDCFLQLYPNQPITINYRTKQRIIEKFITENFSDDWVIDQRIAGGRSRRKPDIYLEQENKMLIIEIDEEQHRRYSEEEENLRLMQIIEDVRQKPIVIIRFNPDCYNNRVKKIKSPWKKNQLGYLEINSNKLSEWNERLEELRKIITFWINSNNIPENNFLEIKLFFDTI